MLYYAILGHKHPEQIKYLVNQLDTSETKIIIHIDGYSDINKFKEIIKKENIHYIENREKVRRGGFGMIKATLKMFEEILPTLGENDHVILISGECLPIKSQKEIINFFKKNTGKSFLSYHKVDKNKNEQEYNRIVEYYFHDLVIPNWINNILEKIVGIFFDLSIFRNQVFCHMVQRCTNILLPKKTYLINTYTIYKGDQRGAFCKEHIQYIFDFLKTGKGKKAYSAFKTTLIPDEMFFQTILLNSHHKKNVINKFLRYLEWSKKNFSPIYLQAKDKKKIINSGKLFARKFDLEKYPIDF